MTEETTAAPPAETKPDAAPANPADKPAEKPADKPATKTAAKADAKPADKPADAKTLMESGEEEDITPQADWPEDWREKLAGEDAKILSTLKRYSSPKTFSNAYFAMKQKLSSGEYTKKLAEGATEEQVAAWRKENDIPESPDKYDLTLPDGLIIGEQDKPLVGEFLKEMHGVNATPTAVKSALTAYYKIVQQQQQDIQQQDTTFRDESENALRTEWGAEFSKNVSMIGSLLATAPQDVADRIKASRTPEGRKFGDDPAMMRWLNQLAREVNPAATVVPGAGANAAGAIADEIANIEKMMGDHKSDYWKGPKVDGGSETKMQVRYRELTTARDRLGARAS